MSWWEPFDDMLTGNVWGCACAREAHRKRVREKRIAWWNGFVDKRLGRYGSFLKELTEKELRAKYEANKLKAKVRSLKKMGLYVGMNYINGEWCPHSSDFSSLNPANNADLGMFPITEGSMVHEAVDAANCAFQTWKNVSRIQRADMFDKLAQLLKRDHQRFVEAISLETGKSVNESHAETIEALHMIQYTAAQGREPYGKVIASELPTKDAYVTRKPKGVVAIISPWNFPLAIGPFWCAAPTILEGNCVVFKPSELTPMVGQMAVELYDEAGFPPGVFNLIHGLGETGAELVRDHHVQTILFTGSAEVGQDIRKHCADTWHKNCSCEMGSKSATMVFADGNRELAVEATVASAFKLSGQRCVSSGRILIERNIYDDFCKQFMEKVETLRYGDPFDPNVLHPADYGPLISAEQKERVMAFNEMVRVDSDASVILDGSFRGEGHYLPPFVYKVEWADKPYLKNEVFGPHVALIPFDDLDDAMRIYNDTDYGLALGVITDDFRKHRQIRDNCGTGMLYINGGSIAAESHLPFGGVGKSGNGYKSASGTYQAVTEEISVTTNYENKMSWAQGMTS